MSNNERIEGRLISVACPAPTVTPLEFLAAGDGEARFYWSDSGEGTTFAGIGSAANLIAWGENRFAGIEAQHRPLFTNGILPQNAPPLATPRLFGGFSFRDDFNPDNAWATFPPAQFTLPHFQLGSDGEDRWLTLNALIPADEDAADILPALTEALTARLESFAKSRSTPPKSARLVEIRYPVSPQMWKEMIESAVEQISQTELEKVVLSHICELWFQDDIDPLPALKRLNRQYPDCYRFLIEPRPRHAFLGATPELLAHTTGKTIHTMALAGSAPRSDDNAQDDAYGVELMNSGKERLEHQLVVDAIRRRLEPIAKRLNIPAQPKLLKLGNIQHLYTPIYGQMSQSSGILPLIQLLHPTPALGGSPRHLALQFIQEAERAPRGWYAAPIGMIDAQLDGTFGVAIRSAVLQHRRAWLHAGGGIVPGSVAEREWAETELKFKPMLNALAPHR